MIDIENPVLKNAEKLFEKRRESPYGNNVENLFEKMHVEPLGGKPWVEIIQRNKDYNRGLVVEYVAPTLVNGEIEILIDETDIEEELKLWETTMILYALGEALSMNRVKKFMEKTWNFVALPDLYYNDT